MLTLVITVLHHCEIGRICKGQERGNRHKFSEPWISCVDFTLIWECMVLLYTVVAKYSIRF